MLYHLLRHFSGFFSDTLHFYAYQHILFRSVLAILTSLAIALLIGPRIIRWLMRIISRHTFEGFGWYRIALSLVVWWALV